jgi:ABC-type transport system substrate-binding protein
LNSTYISLNTEIPPLDKVSVRRAINFAIQRDKWMKIGLGIYSHSDGPIPPATAGFDPQLRGYTYDPTKARQLIHEAGVPLPIHLAMWHPIDDQSRFAAQGIQSDLKAIGIELDLHAVSYAELFSVAQTRGRVAMACSAWNSAIPDPVDMLGTQFDGRSVTNPATVNFAFYNSAKVNHLLDEAASEVDLKVRYARYREAERQILADAPWVCLGHLDILGLPQPWLRGPLTDPIYWYRFDRVWIER